MFPPWPPGDHVDRYEVAHGSVLVVGMGLGDCLQEGLGASEQETKQRRRLSKARGEERPKPRARRDHHILFNATRVLRMNKPHQTISQTRPNPAGFFGSASGVVGLGCPRPQGGQCGEARGRRSSSWAAVLFWNSLLRRWGRQRWSAVICRDRGALGAADVAWA
jgi:hypothetical protein